MADSIDRVVRQLDALRESVLELRRQTESIERQGALQAEVIGNLRRENEGLEDEVRRLKRQCNGKTLDSKGLRGGGKG